MDVARDEERSAALLVRVWTEGGGAFRARLTAVDTSAGGPAGAAPAGEEVTLTVTASPGEVLDAVRAWLDRFVGAAP